MLWFHISWRWGFSVAQVEKFKVLSHKHLCWRFHNLPQHFSFPPVPAQLSHTSVGPFLTHSLSQHSSAPYGVPTASSNLAPTLPPSAVPDAQTLLVLPSTWSSGVRSTFQFTFTSHRLSAQSFNTSGTSNFTKFLQPPCLSLPVSQLPPEQSFRLFLTLCLLNGQNPPQPAHNIPVLSMHTPCPWAVQIHLPKGMETEKTPFSFLDTLTGNYFRPWAREKKGWECDVTQIAAMCVSGHRNGQIQPKFA